MSTRAETWKYMRDELKSFAHKLGISQTRIGIPFVLGAEATALYIQTVGPAPLGPPSEMEL